VRITATAGTKIATITTRVEAIAIAGIASKQYHARPAPFLIYGMAPGAMSVLLRAEYVVPKLRRLLKIRTTLPLNRSNLHGQFMNIAGTFLLVAML
jgi:hypothetical protein